MHGQAASLHHQLNSAYDFPFHVSYVHYDLFSRIVKRKYLPQQIRHWYDGLILVGRSVLNELGNPGTLQLQKVWLDLCVEHLESNSCLQSYKNLVGNKKETLKSMQYTMYNS